MQTLDRIKAPVADLVEQFHQQFNDVLESKSEWLHEAVLHLAGATGKQVRPILTTLTAGMLTGQTPPETSVEAGLLLELIHTATLIHDDVIDEAKTRRSKATLGAIYDNRVAVLMGDFVLSSALLGAIALGDIRIIQVVSGIGRELTEGEIRQYESAELVRLSEENYYDIIRQKTAVLFAACTEVAALTAGASDEDREQVIQLGDHLGMAFQIRDDIFDYYSSDVGKPTGNDLREGKVTLPLLHTLLELQQQGKADKYLALLAEKPLSESAIEELTELAHSAGGMDYAWARLREHIEAAKEIISRYPQSVYRDSLLALADFIAERSR